MSTLPWTEKYRPKTIDELTADESTLNKIKKMVSDLSMPNMIITGMPGIGKTTTISCLSKCLLGKHYSQGVLELNASDERGIKAVQDSITQFCTKKLVLNKPGEKKYANHKIVLLDEADNMTPKAQHLINALMDDYNKSTRFAFTCNNSSDIIESIQSRCIILRYRKLSEAQIKKRLLQICEKENVKFNVGGINAVITTANGDMRQAINNLQLTHVSYGKVSMDNVYKICNKPHPLMIVDILKNCYEHNLVEALKHIKNLQDNGFSGQDIAMEMITCLKTRDYADLPEDKRMEFMQKLGRSYLVISGGIDTPLQLTSCVATLCT